VQLIIVTPERWELYAYEEARFVSLRIGDAITFISGLMHSVIQNLEVKI